MNEDGNLIVFKGEGGRTTLTENVIFNFDVSEDEFENSDLDDLDDTTPGNVDEVYAQIVDGIEHIVDPIEVELYSASSQVITNSPSMMATSPELEQNSKQGPAPLANSKRKPSDEKFRKLVWKEKNLDLTTEEVQFTGDSELPPDIMELSTPFQFFSYFFTEGLVGKIVEETRLYSVQIDSNKPFNVSNTDIYRYLGVVLATTLMTARNVRLYWNPRIHLPVIQQAMSINDFEKIRRFLHFNDNSKQVTRDKHGHDPLYKIKPVTDVLLKQFSSIPREEKLAVDEQMCATKTKHHLRQYMPKKPHKWGFKFFSLCGMTGYNYNFEIYTGKEHAPEKRRQDEPDLGACANVVVRLGRIIPENKNHKLYFDNYYTTIGLMTYFKKKGVFTLGTVRQDRVPGSKLPKPRTEKEIKKIPRGTVYEYVAKVDDCEVSNLMWVDNKCVTLLSTVAGTNPLSQVKRYDRKERKSVMVPCPNVVSQYNQHMGGVDLMDSLIGRYKIIMRTKKWYFRIFNHLVDLSVINAWLLYLRAQKQRGADKNGEPMKMTLADFRLDLAETLCLYGKMEKSKRGRPSNEIASQPPGKKRKTVASYSPPNDVKYDQLSHWPEHTNKSCKQRCKFPNCKGFTVIQCSKCNVALCLNVNNNCFFKYHNK